MRDPWTNPAIEGSCLCGAVHLAAASARPALRAVQAVRLCHALGTRARGLDDWIALNARVLDHAIIADVPVGVLDGDKTWRVLDKYRRPAMFISPSRRWLAVRTANRRGRALT